MMRWPIATVAAWAAAVLLASGVCPTAEGQEGVHELLAGERDFDGRGDALEVKLPETVYDNAQVTVTAWIYPRVPKGAFTNRGIVSQPGRLYLGMESNGEGARPLATTGPLVCLLNTASPDGAASVKRIASPECLAPDRWSHVAVSYDGKSIRLFLDGAEVAALAETGALCSAASAGPTAVGCQAGGWERTDFWAGLLRDVRLYGEALPAQAIGELAASRPPTPPANRVFRSDGPPVWVFNPGLEGGYREDPVFNYPSQWCGSIWYDAKGRWRRDAEYPHSGEVALRMECDAIPFGGMSLFQPAARIPMVPGRTYTLSACMRSDFDVDVRMGISAYGGGILKEFTAIRRWQKYSFTETYTGVTTSGFLVFYYGSMRPGNLVIDDVELTVQE